jgi:transposase
VYRRWKIAPRFCWGWLQTTGFDMEEIVAAMAKVGIAGGCTTVRRLHEQHGFSFRKKALYAEEQKRAEVVRAHRRWIREQSLLGPAQLVIDETCTSTSMAWLRGRSARGRRLIGYPPHEHRKATTFVAALRLRNVTAPFVLDGAVNGRMFPAYAKQRLAPRLECRDIAIMDNLLMRKIAGVQEVIEAAGATPCYPPPYSPDLNPIEPAFSKFEALLRKAAKRTIPCAGLGASPRSHRPQEFPPPCQLCSSMTGICFLV